MIKPLNNFLLIDIALPVNSFHKLAQPLKNLEYTIQSMVFPTSPKHYLLLSFDPKKFLSIQFYFSTFKNFKYKYFHLPWFILNEYRLIFTDQIIILNRF